MTTPISQLSTPGLGQEHVEAGLPVDHQVLADSSSWMSGKLDGSAPKCSAELVEDRVARLGRRDQRAAHQLAELARPSRLGLERLVSSVMVIDQISSEDDTPATA